MTLYRTFTRQANNWREFTQSRKPVISHGLTFEQARKECERYNEQRTEAQKESGQMMEFEREDS